MIRSQSQPQDFVDEASASQDVGFKRELTLYDALMINVGTTLASAIFIVPAIVLATTRTAFMSSVVWMVAGGLSWCGAVTFSELAVMYPRAGGQYVYLKQAFSRFWGFHYGWTLFSVIQTASIAAATVALMTYLAYFIPMSATTTKVGSIGLIMGLTIWNCFAVRTSANIQNRTTVIKLLTIVAIALICFLFGGDGLAAFQEMVPKGPATRTVAGFGAAMVAALWAFDGWAMVTFVSGEVRNPDRVLPRALTFSVIGLIIIYLLVTNAFIYALPAADMMVSNRIAADAVEHVMGRIGGGLVAFAVIVSCFAAVNGLIFTAARVYFAMARDGVFFSWAAKLSDRKVPVNAILAQGVWASALTLTGRYDQLFTYVVFTSWVAYLLGAVAVMVLRQKDPGRLRPYRAYGYPYITAFFGVAAWALLLEVLWHNPRDSVIGLSIVLLGVPLYYYWKRRSKNIETADSSFG